MTPIRRFFRWVFPYRPWCGTSLLITRAQKAAEIEEERERRGEPPLTHDELERMADKAARKELGMDWFS